MWDVTRSLAATARELRSLSTDRPTDFQAAAVLKTLYALMGVDTLAIAADACGALAKEAPRGSGQTQCNRQQGAGFR